MTKYKCEIEECTPDSRIFHMCPDCGKQFITKSSMHDHQIKHSNEKNFVCMKCGKCFEWKESLHFHTKKHAGIEDYICDKFPAKYVSASALVPLAVNLGLKTRWSFYHLIHFGLW